MRLIQCDRCGAEIKVHASVNTQTGTATGTTHGHTIGVGPLHEHPTPFAASSTYDLCERCHDRLGDFFAGRSVSELATLDRAS